MRASRAGASRQNSRASANVFTRPITQDVRRRLLRWANRNGRQFVWRSWRDPYRLAVTEVLLKQTRAEAVAVAVPTLFLRYPTPNELAVAGPELEEAIRSLGFGMQRAGQLRALAAALLERVPKQGAAAIEWQALPGIGPYAAGMLAGVLGARSAVAVDTNVARVVCRLYGLSPNRTEARKRPDVWMITTKLLADARSPIQVLWAVLDLAAIVCVARNPHCNICPLRTRCFVGLSSRDQRTSVPSSHP